VDDDLQSGWAFYDEFDSASEGHRYAGGGTYDAALAAAHRIFGTPTAHSAYAIQIVDTTLGNRVVTPRDLLLASIDPNAEKKSMIKLNVKREGGRLFLYVHAKGMHDILDSIGVPTAGEMYADRPRATTQVADRTTHIISTDALLRKEYPSKFDLTAVYGTEQPPSIANLQRLTESAFEQTRKILEHYQPIDISVSIQKKEIK
jgi:hypothetical protein